MDDYHFACCAILIAVFAITAILILTLKRLNNQKDTHMAYYIEGTIDAIEIFAGSLRFSLLPSSEFLQVLDDGSKKALLLDASAETGRLVKPAKNAIGKECLWFSIRRCLLHFLMSANNNHNTIRVWCGEGDTQQFLAAPPSPDTSISAEGIRVF